jgi:transcriptional regulator
MYVPASFRVDDRDTLHAFVRQYSFATLVTAGDEPFATHVPLLLDPDRGAHGTLVGHFARANPHWQMDHRRWGSLAIFHGPHAYISPSWYRSGAPAVPTWNYAAVHAVGNLSLIEDATAVAAILERTTRAYESSQARPWVNPLPQETIDKLIGAVVAFEMPIERLEGKFKLGQNRKPEDQIGAIEGLEAATDADSAALTAFARKRLGLARAEGLE